MIYFTVIGDFLFLLQSIEKKASLKENENNQ